MKYYEQYATLRIFSIAYTIHKFALDHFDVLELKFFCIIHLIFKIKERDSFEIFDFQNG